MAGQEVASPNEFQRLQSKLASMWHQIGAALTDETWGHHTVVVIPSITVDIEFSTSALKAYEERMLFMLFLLRDPQIELVLVTSEPVQQEIIDYYLELIPGIVSTHARKRLTLVSPEDGSPLPLSKKLLSRPALIRHLRALIPDPDNAHMVPFIADEEERELSLALGIPMFAADPQYLNFGTKSGCRRVFAEEGIRHPLGFENLHSLEEVVDAIMEIRWRKPGVERVVVKLNQGLAGLGNVLLELPPPGTPDVASRIRQSLKSRAETPGKPGSLLTSLAEEGAIVEEFISGKRVLSPSVQMRITPLKDVQIISTHDQMLGGVDGQSYLGASFPADPAYSRLITADARKIGERLAREGILGRFAVDFVVTETESGEWESHAIEINLRKGGTTAPYLILQFLTDGRYDAEQGVFLTAQKQPRFYVASDHVESEKYRHFNTASLFEIVSVHGLHFNHAEETGVVMHMMSDVGELGRLGVTAIGKSPEDARRIYLDFITILDKEASLLA